jgi:hypothetical protein
MKGIEHGLAADIAGGYEARQWGDDYSGKTLPLVKVSPTR